MTIQLKKYLSALTKTGFFLFVAIAAFYANQAKADSLSLSVPISYEETIASNTILPAPNVIFDINVSASLGSPTAGTLTASGCPTNAFCYFSGGNPSSPNSLPIASIPSSGTYTYNMNAYKTVGGTTLYAAPGTYTITFTLTPTGCGAGCTVIGSAIAKIKVNPAVSQGVVTSYVEAGWTGGDLIAPPSPLEVSNWAGSAPLHWTAVSDQSWCHLSQSSGTVAPFSTSQIEVSYDSPESANLPVGWYLNQCIITFTDTSTGEWTSPATGDVYIDFFVNEASYYDVTLSKETCNAVTINWKDYPGATGYNVYRMDWDGWILSNYASDHDGQFAPNGASTLVKSNAQGNSFVDSTTPLQGIHSYGDDTWLYYWVEPIGTGAGYVMAHGTPEDGYVDFYSAVLCGGPQLANQWSNLGYVVPIYSGSGGSYTEINVSISNMGDEALEWSASGSDPNCKVGDATGATSGSIPPFHGKQARIYAHDGQSQMRLGDYECVMTITTNSVDQSNAVGPITAAGQVYPALARNVETDDSICGSIKVTWEAGSDSSGYKVYRHDRAESDDAWDYMAVTVYGAKITEGSMDLTDVATVSASPYPTDGIYSYVDTTAVPGHVYDYAIVNSPGGIVEEDGWANDWHFGGPFQYYALSQASSNFPPGFNYPFDDYTVNNPGAVSHACQAPAAICPSIPVQLSAITIGTSQTATAGALSAYIGGSFHSSDNSVASVSGTTVTAHTSGVTNISGSGWDIYLPSAPSWHSIAMSSSGQYQAAGDYNTGYMYISSDYGNTWLPKAVPARWFNVAMSSNGQFMTAIEGTGPATSNLYLSSDYGNSWTLKDSSRYWDQVVISDSGQYQAAIANVTEVYISSNYGQTWTSKQNGHDLFGLAMSSNGKYVTVGGHESELSVSSDFGQTWTSKGQFEIYYVVMSASGQYQTANDVYVSSDYGNTWSYKASDGIGRQAESDDGQFVTAAPALGNLTVSSDYGNTWSTTGPSKPWTGIVVSSNGQYQTAVFNGTGSNIYTSHDYGRTWALTTSAGNCDLDATQLTVGNGLTAGAVCNSSAPGPCRGSGETWYEYDFYLPDRVTVGASFRYPQLIKDYSPTNIPIPGFSNFYSIPGPSSLNPCDMTSDSSGELDCLSTDPHGGIFQYIFNYGAMPRQLGPFTGSGWDAPDHHVPSVDTVFLQDGIIKTVLKDGPDPLCGQIKVTWNYAGIADSFKIYKDGSYIGTAPYPNNYFIYSTGSDFTDHTYSVSAVVDGTELGQATWNGNPVAADSCGAPATVTLDNSGCEQMVVNWTGVVGSGVTYNVYRNATGNPPDTVNDLLDSGLTSTTYTDTAPPAATSTPYYYFVAAIGSHGESLATGGTSNPSSISSCLGNLGDSDIDIVKLNGNQLYNHPSLPNGSQCNSSTDPLPAGLNLKLGDVLTFSVNLCNDQGNGNLGLNRVTNPLINLALPQGNTDFKAYYNSTLLSYDGAQDISYTPATGHYFVYGSVPNQTIVFYLTGNTINQGDVAAITYEAELTVPAHFQGSLSRFQSSFNPLYDIGAGPSRYTPLLPFTVGPNNSPSIKETK